MRATFAASCRGRQAGVGLIEVLVAVLVLSMGLLGLANLQMFSLRHNQSAHERAMAVVQIYSIADAMRAERSVAMSKGFNVALDREAAMPTGSAFATAAVTNWRENLEALLGEAAIGSIDCNGAECEIVVQWDDSRAGGQDATALQIVTVVQL
jgi:type IV pilus assembly protein PilV